MKNVSLGRSPLQCGQVAYGCWRLAGSGDAAHVTPEREAHGRAAVIAAYEAGCTLFDLADVYGLGAAERIFGQALRLVAGMRDQILVASKCGIRKAGEPTPQAPYRYDFSAAHIIRSCEQSLERLGIETLDLYMLHRPDLLAAPEEVAAAFGQLRQSGKVREFGVSNFRPSQVTLLQRACPMRLAVNQIEFSLAHLAPLSDGTLDQCLTEGLTPLAWSPLGGGRLASGAGVEMQDPHHARKVHVHETLEAIARDRGVGRVGIAVAWLLRHPSGVVPIIGSTQPDHIRAAAQAGDLELSREEWYRLLEAAQGQRLP